jgi:hypothetical protein
MLVYELSIFKKYTAIYMLLFVRVVLCVVGCLYMCVWCTARVCLCIWCRVHGVYFLCMSVCVRDCVCLCMCVSMHVWGVCVCECVCVGMCVCGCGVRVWSVCMCVCGARCVVCILHRQVLVVDMCVYVCRFICRS